MDIKLINLFPRLNIKMEILKVIFRILVFSIGFYFLLEYVVTCSLSTSTCIITIIVSIIIVVLLFIFFGLKNTKLCSCCGTTKFIGISSKVKNMFK
jgi:hypothetical protein